MKILRKKLTARRKYAVYGQTLASKESRLSVLQPDDPVFSFNGGRPVNPGTISQTFHRLVTQHPFSAPVGVACPWLHCLRHSFAVGALLRWYRSGIDPGQRLIHLSTLSWSSRSGVNGLVPDRHPGAARQGEGAI